METVRGRSICLIGPESTGKTELARRLAEHFGGVYVAEFAREYAEARNNQLSYDDVEPIARGEIANLEARSSNLVIWDTDLLSTVVYARHYYGKCPDWICDQARHRRADLYLLMDIDVPWVADAARDEGGEGREDLFDAFRAALDEFDTRWRIISGTWEERERAAIGAVTSVLSA